MQPNHVSKPKNIWNHQNAQELLQGGPVDKTLASVRPLSFENNTMVQMTFKINPMVPMIFENNQMVPVTFKNNPMVPMVVGNMSILPATFVDRPLASVGPIAQPLNNQTELLRDEHNQTRPIRDEHNQTELIRGLTERTTVAGRGLTKRTTMVGGGLTRKGPRIGGRKQQQVQHLWQQTHHHQQLRQHQQPKGPHLQHHGHRVHPWHQKMVQLFQILIIPHLGGRGGSVGFIFGALGCVTQIGNSVSCAGGSSFENIQMASNSSPLPFIFLRTVSPLFENGIPVN